MRVKVWSGLAFLPTILRRGPVLRRDLGLDVAFDEGNTVERSGREWRQDPAVRPRGTAIRALPQPEASIFPARRTSIRSAATSRYPASQSRTVPGRSSGSGHLAGTSIAWVRRPGTARRQYAHPTPGYTVPDMDWKFELVAIPVTDVDRAKAFYVEQVGFHADHDYQVTTCCGSSSSPRRGQRCSIVLGTGVTQMPPGSQKGVQCVVADVEAARRELIAHGVQASDVDVQPWELFRHLQRPRRQHLGAAASAAATVKPSGGSGTDREGPLRIAGTSGPEGTTRGMRGSSITATMT